MEVRSLYKYARMSPFKVRELTREIQGLPASEALDIINYSPLKASRLVGQTLRSAIANAENNHNLEVAKLTVKEATVGEGPTLKRIMPRARGSASPIRVPGSNSVPAGACTITRSSADAPGSVLTQLRTSLGPLRPVLLKEAEGESALVVKPASDAMLEITPRKTPSTASRPSGSCAGPRPCSVPIGARSPSAAS